MLCSRALALSTEWYLDIDMAEVPGMVRRQTATVHVGGQDKYPIFDAHSARSALKLIHNAKPPLTPAQEAAVRAKARKYGVT